MTPTLSSTSSASTSTLTPRPSNLPTPLDISNAATTFGTAGGSTSNHSGIPSASTSGNSSSAQTPTLSRPGLRVDTGSLPFPYSRARSYTTTAALPPSSSSYTTSTPPRSSSPGGYSSPYQPAGPSQTSANLYAPYPARSSSAHSSPASPGDRNDVAMAVRGLRGQSPPSPPPPPPPPKSASRARASTSPEQPMSAAMNGTMSGAGYTEGSASGSGASAGAATGIATGPYGFEVWGPPPGVSPIGWVDPRTLVDEKTVKTVANAVKSSKDEGDTLDMSRLDIRRIGDGLVEMFNAGVGRQRKGVWRLALSYNLLKDGAIADSFMKLSRLRYLNLKGNFLTQFPHAITQMPALEILDMSKNKITSFPEAPGRLVQLKVLSLTSNKLYSLPTYLVDFTELKVFKVDQNPIEWPPKKILGSLCEPVPPKPRSNGNDEDGRGEKPKDEDLRPWIDAMKRWLRERTSESGALLDHRRAEEDAYLASEEEPYSATSFVTPPSARQWPGQEGSMTAPSSQETIRRTAPPRDELGLLFSQRNVSATFSEDSLLRSASPYGYSTSPRPTHTRDHSASSFASPPSASTDASFHSQGQHSRNPSSSLPPLPPLPVPGAQGHSRGASYTPAQRMSGQLTAKKSLPDLRQSHAKIISDRRGDAAGEVAMPMDLGITVAGGTFNVGGRADMIKSPTTGVVGGESSRTLNRKGSVDALPRVPGDVAPGDMPDKGSAQDGPLIDESRNSYFRRLSTLPSSTISKAIPPSLLRFIDAIRGILFALSQLHSALRQYLVFAVNERVSSMFARVMEPAGTYMNKLINALDRFDSMSRRGTPPSQAIRGVFDATKESVAVFGKVVAVLKMQVPAMRGNDSRYTRTLLVNIYGAMAEVASSWQVMTGLMGEIKMLLLVDGAALRGGAGATGGVPVGGQKMVATGSFTGRTPISPIIERRESHSPQSQLGTSPLNLSHTPAGEQGSPTLNSEGRRNVSGARSRRQAGSFSSQDVERGMMMGSPGGPRTGEMQPEGGMAAYQRHRPSESAHMVLPEQKEESETEEEDEEEAGQGMQLPQVPFSTTSPNGTSSTFPNSPPDMQMALPNAPFMGRTSSQQGHRPSSSSGSSHALSLASGVPHPSRKLSVDVRPPTPASATLFDEDLLDVIETATDAAFTSWLKLAEEVGASSPQFANGPTHTHGKTSSQGSTSSHLELARMALPPMTPIDNPRRPSTISAKHHAELLHLLSVAEQITTALRESLMGLRADPMAYATTTLPDDAQAFIKIVVKVSELVKTLSAGHSFPSEVRQALGRLTQATRECAILIQVSSLRPGNATPAPIPPASARSMSPMRPGYPGSSTEDLGHHPPASAGYHPHQQSFDGGRIVQGVPGHGHTPSTGLRGLQLPSRQLALGRSRSANAVPLTIPMPMPYVGGQSVGGGGGGGNGGGREPPRSAQASQVAF
ncbi:hypothetical protein IAT38_000679 [Cryptococcus sp. DSM 104549]